MFGAWDVDVSVKAFPQRVATALGELGETLIGATYTPIAYLGHQEVNGINHAVLAEQLITTGKDTKNVVVVMFNEKPGSTDLALVGIERVVESGAELGGTVVNVQTDIPEDAGKAFAEAFNGFVGSKVSPFALLATQVVKGTNYVFAAEVTPVTADPVKSVSLVVVNGMTKDVSFVDLLTSKCDTMSLGYAFTWLRNQNTSLGKPLGEWP